jgi:hypothetical protein
MGAALDDRTLIERIRDYWPKRSVNDGIFETRSVGVMFSAFLEVPLTEHGWGCTGGRHWRKMLRCPHRRALNPIIAIINL